MARPVSVINISVIAWSCAGKPRYSVSEKRDVLCSLKTAGPWFMSYSEKNK